MIKEIKYPNQLMSYEHNQIDKRDQLIKIVVEGTNEQLIEFIKE